MRILMPKLAGHIIIIIIIIIISLHNSAMPRRHLKPTLRLKTIKCVFKCCGVNKDEIAKWLTFVAQKTLHTRGGWEF